MKLTTITLAAVSGALVVGSLVTAAASAQAAPAASTASTTVAAKSSLTSSTGKVVRATTSATQGHAGYVPAARRAPVAGHAGLSPNSVIGTDSRYQVSATTTYPNSAIVLIKRNGSLWCTGWLVGKDTLVSAGHCVTDGHGTWYSGLTFSPGSNGGNAPFGTCASRGTWAFTAWANRADSNYDGSIVKLNCTVGNTTGWFPTWWQSASLNGLSTRVQGYPGDKPSTQWVSYDYVRASSTDRLYYQNDTVGGESGSPIFQYRSGQSFCNGYCVMGIHTNGSDGTNNSGTRFTSAKLSTIYSIVNQP